MAKDIKKKFTVDLEITTDNAEKQLKQTATNMKKMFTEIGSASDKMSYLREVVDYLEQVDAWLTQLQAQDPKAFKKALKAMDKDLAHGLANIFGTSKTDLQMLDNLATQINSIDTKSSTTEVKKLAKAVNELFQSIGQEPRLDIEGMFTGKADVKQQMKRQLALNKAFKEFIALWADASAKNIGNLMPGGVSGGTGVADAVETDNKKLEQQVKRLQSLAAAYQETLAIFDGKNAGRKTTQQNDVDTLKKLKESFEQAAASVQEFEAAGNTASNEYKQAVANAMRAATLFKNTRDYLFSSGSDKASQLATDYAPIAKQAQQYIENLKKSDIFKEVRAYVEQQITNINTRLQKLHGPDGGQSTAPDSAVAAQQKHNEELASSYDKLTAKVKEYIDVQKQLKTLEKGSQARKDALVRAGQIQNDIVSMKDLDNDKEDNVYAIFEEMNAGAISSTDAVSKLCGILQIDMPQSAKVATATASVSFDQVGKHAVNATEYIHGMTLALKEMFKVMSKPAEAEYKMTINGQSIEVLNGQFDEVDTRTLAASYLANLKSGMVVNAHSHMGRSTDTNQFDFKNVIDSFYGGVSKISATVGQNEIATWNLAGVAMEDAYKALTEIEKEMERIGSVNVNKINEIFTKINPAYTNVAKSWKPEQFADLAQFIYDIGQKSENAITPVQRFQNILKMFAKNIDLSKYTDLIDNVTEENAVSTFNKIMNKENVKLSDGSLLQVDKVDTQTIDDVIKATEAAKQKFAQLRSEATVTYDEIVTAAKKYSETNNSANAEGLDFFKKYFHVSEMPEINKWFEEVALGERDLMGTIHAIAGSFGIDPDDMEQFDTAQTKMQEFLNLAKSYDEMEYISENDVNAGIKKLEEMKAELVELAQQGKLTAQDLETINAAFDKTEVHLTSMDHETYQDGGKYDHTYASELAAAEDENKQLRQENTKLREQNATLQADNGILQAHADGHVTNEEYDELVQENAQLEHKLELLQDIATQYGISITKKDRDRYEALVDKEMDVGLTEKEEDRQFELGEKIEEADAAMEELGETYEKIILKLANGKKIEILPDDKGLRALDKIANEYYEGEYNGQEIEDIVFVRKQEQEVVAQTNQQLEEQQQQIAQVTKAYDDVFDVLQKISGKWKDLDTVDSAIGSMPLSDIDGYIKELERLIKLIESVDPNFQYGDKDEHDGAVKTLEKMRELSARTKLTDEFKNTINQFEQLGKFEWSDDLNNGYLKILQDIRNGTYKTIGQCVAKFNELSAAAAEPQIMDTTTAFKELVNYISKSGYSTAPFFDALEDGALVVNDALKKILTSLGLIDENGEASFSSLKSGFTNKGGFVSDQYAMIARPDYYLGKIQSIQPKLQKAQSEGAQIGAIVDIIEDKAKGLIYEIQNTVPGESVLGHHSGKTNMDVLNASEAHIEGLVNTLQILAKNGLFVDWGGDNVLYDSQKGFSIIDMGDKGDKHFTVSAQNTLQENLDRMVKEMFKFATPDMQQALQDGIVKNLYASAQKIDSTVVNPYAPKQQKAAQTASTQVAAVVKSESDAHDQNTASINAENEALKAQIELKKQAQSMKWEAFATDDSLSALKQAAGMQTLGQLEAFWKKSNYEKDVAFHEIPVADAKKILKDKLPKGLASAWYGSADFTVKSKLENEVLSDDEIRNAALNVLYDMYKQMPDYQKGRKGLNIKSFEDFLETELTVYRGDQSPLIYDDPSKLSFSFKKSTAQGFHSNLGTAKIKPKNTIGNAGSGFYSEVETFINSYETSWYQKTGEAFEDFYNQQTKEMQKEIDAGLVNFEKKRVSDIIGDDLATLTHKAGQDALWQQKVAGHVSKGTVPDQLDVIGDDSDYDKFATAYNSLSDTMKKFVMFFASMDALSASLPKQFSISTSTAGGGYKYGKNAVGDGAKLFNAILNDPEGRNQHIAKLTGEYAFNLMGVTPADINAVADAHERNAQAINAEAQAQKDLNSLQARYDMVMDDLWDSAVDANGSKHNDLSKLWSQLFDVQHSDQDLVNQGLYTQKSTGQSVDATDLFQLVVDIESKYNENLDYVKDYLKQVYSGIDFGNITPASAMSPEFDSVKMKTYETAKNAYKSGNQREYFKVLGVLNHLNDVNAASSEDILNAQYTDTDIDRAYDISHLIEMVKRIEDAYGENFDYVYDYLKMVYGSVTIDDALTNLSNNNVNVTSRPEKQYTVADYEAAYAAAPIDMQSAIDDLAVFQQRYEQLYALTNTRPIELMIPGNPTLKEIEKVIDTFDQFKAKQREIFKLQLIDYEGNKEQIQELQAEAVGLQNKLKGASLGDDADVEKYKSVYGFTSDQDADRLKKLVDMIENVHTVMNDLTRIGEQKMSLIPQEMQDMLDADDTGAAESFLAQHAQQIQSAKAAAQQANANAAASKQQLQTEQDITAEKQRQAEIDQQQATQTATDAIHAQDVQQESVVMGQVLQQVEAVKAAVLAKTAAFEAEGQAVATIAQQEIDALKPLLDLLNQIQNSLQVIFAANNWNIGGVNLSQDKTSSSSMPNILGEIKSLLGQIYGVLSKSTGVESDNKNSAQVKAPVVNNNAMDSDAYKALAAKIPDDIAKDGTLQQIFSAVNVIAKRPKDSENADLKNLSAALLVAATELKNASNGIIEQKKKAQSDTSVAQARISNKDEYIKIKSAATGALGDRALDSEVTEMQALANGIVKVTGWLKVAEDAWEGFTVQINEANEASKLAFSINSKAAKQAAAQAKALKEQSDDEDPNFKKYDRKQTEALAQEKIAKATAEGKIATVQFKDSGRYTITTLEKIGGLTKQVFQTFDENDAMIERTTATMSNAALAKVQELQQVAQYGFNHGLIGDGDQLYQAFAKASQELEIMTGAYSQADQLSNDQIDKWKLQIDLVSKLGKDIQKLVAARQNPVLNEVFSSKKQKQNATFNTDYAKLKETIAIPDSFTNKIQAAGDAIKNAVNNSELQVAQNNWAALRKEIELAAMQQDLYIKKSGAIGSVKKNAYGATQVVNAQANFNALSSRAKAYKDDYGSGVVSKAYDKYEASFKRLIALQSQFGSASQVSDAQKVQFTELKNECNNYYKELKKIIDASEKFKSNAENPMQVMGDVDVNSAVGRGNALKEYVQTMYEGKATVQGFNGDMTQLKFTLKNTDGTVTQMSAAFNDAKTHMGTLRGETKKITTGFDLFAGKLKELGTYAMARLGIDELIQAIRTGINYVREIDTALTDLKKVTDETDASYDRFLQNMSQTASRVGSTVSELTTMAAEWARLGYSMEEAGMLAESTAILLNVSEFSDATTASEALISTMQAFGYAADESQHVVDILNEVGKLIARR